MEGGFNIEVGPFSGDTIYIVGVRGVFANSFKRKYVHAFNTVYFHSWKQVWWFYHDKGLLPYANKGWYEHNKKIVRVIEILENLYAHYQNEVETKSTEAINREIERKRRKK